MPEGNAMEFLSFIGEGEEQPPLARGPRRARGRGRGISGRPVASAMEILAFIGERDEQPPQARNPVGRPRGRRQTGALKYNHLQKATNQQTVLRFQMRRFNISGRAVNVDGLMLDAAPRVGRKGRRPKVKVGQGGWKIYLPETIQQARRDRLQQGFQMLIDISLVASDLHCVLPSAELCVHGQ